MGKQPIDLKELGLKNAGPACRPKNWFLFHKYESFLFGWFLRIVLQLWRGQRSLLDYFRAQSCNASDIAVSLTYCSCRIEALHAANLTGTWSCSESFWHRSLGTCTVLGKLLWLGINETIGEDGSDCGFRFMKQRGSSWKSDKTCYVQKFVNSVTWVIFRGVYREIETITFRTFLFSP